MVQEDYHSQNPYHNAVHAADVTQAMHCYLKEPKVKNLSWTTFNGCFAVSSIKQIGSQQRHQYQLGSSGVELFNVYWMLSWVNRCFIYMRTEEQTGLEYYISFLWISALMVLKLGHLPF